MTGAAYLCAKAAYRSGAGLVEIFTHESGRDALAALIPEAIINTYGDDYSFVDLASSLERANTVAIGCGLGVGSLQRRLVGDVLRHADREKTALVIDADGINVISRNPSLLKYVRGAILTPHMAEMARLVRAEANDILASPQEYAYGFAKRYGAVCLLKDNRTVVSDGSERIYLNQSGNSGMATGGSGDVLAGVIAGLVAQRSCSELSLFELSCLGAYVHGLAGDLAAEKLGKYALMASDIIAALPAVVR